MQAIIENTHNRPNNTIGKHYSIVYDSDSPKQRVIMVYPYDKARITLSTGVKVKKELLNNIWEMIPNELRDNKIVTIIEDVEGMGTTRRFAVYFKDDWAMIALPQYIEIL